MKLSKIQFEDFKSICEEFLDIEDGITTLVGINESGKSNVLSAIEKVDKKKKLENFDIRRNSVRVYEDSASPKLKMFFEVDSDEATQLAPMFGLKKEELSKIILSKEADRYTLNFPLVNYEKSTLSKEVNLEVDTSAVQNVIAQIEKLNAELSERKKELATTEDVSKKVGINTTITTLEEKKSTLDEEKKTAESLVELEKEKRINDAQTSIRKSLLEFLVKDYLPKVLLFDSVGIENFYLPADGRVEIDKLITSPGKYKQIVNLLLLGGINNLDILKPSEDSRKNVLRKQKLNQASTKINTELLRKHWPLEDVEFHLSTEETNILLINLREKGDDTMFVPGDRSRGLQWSVAFNIYFLSESSGGELRNSILLVDEPGVFLHIDAQKKLLEETFPAILAGNNQIIYTTHLPYLIHPKYPERIRILEKQKKGGETQIGNKAWSEGRVGEIPEPVKTALGTKWTEWFGQEDRNCMVEGPSDQVILRSLISKVGGEFNFYPAYGKNSVPSALVLSKLENKNSIGVIDNDLSKEEVKELKDKLKSVNISTETVVSIDELAEDDKIATIEDIIPEDIYRDAIHKVYKYQLSQLDPNYKKEDIPVSHPRVKNFEKFMEKKISKGDHTFKKMEIARAVADIVSDLAIPAANNAKWTLVRKISRSIDSLINKKLLLKREENK